MYCRAFCISTYMKPGMSFDEGCTAALEAAKSTRKGIMKACLLHVRMAFALDYRGHE